MGLPKFRPIPGDTFVPIDKASFERMQEALQKQEDFDWKDWSSKYKNEI
ncbi:hypothetical protein KQI88_04610 [Alkaliphilus sp. MSJ-5]|uniref:Uncharacterized protein n=1 Tax=Alkaliphilus flagellatus TaxID=2841507 RepID=A0ABS6G2U7_9FIRM|nr:hypothetical protein [Alkaliphilus flagellatus]MBU5675691.1 hypothetical protein [Alkaliphilus flagellatus]